MNNEEAMRENMMHHYGNMSLNALEEQKTLLEAEYWRLQEQLNIVRLGKAAVMTLIHERKTNDGVYENDNSL